MNGSRSTVVDEHFIDVGGVRTRWREAGEGAPVVLVHGGLPGGGAGADAWPDVVYGSIAAAGFRAIGFDRLGQAMTGDPPRDDQYRPSAIVAHALLLLERLGVEKAAVVGQSMGAFVACRMALEAPSLVARLGIVNSGGIAPAYDVSPPTGYAPGSAMHRVYGQLMTGDERNDAEVLSVTTDHITDEWVAKVRAMRESPCRAATAAAFDPQRAVFHLEFQRSKTEVLDWFRSGRYTKPTVIIWGVGDPTTTAEDALDLYRILCGPVSHLRLHYLNRCGHWPFREYPEEFAALLVDFLRHDESDSEDAPNGSGG